MNDQATTQPNAAPIGNVERLPRGLPLIYADQVPEVIYGLHTSKLVLSVETGGGELQPVAAAVVPTANLVALALTILTDLSSEVSMNEIEERNGSYRELLLRVRPHLASLKAEVVANAGDASAGAGG